MSILDIPKECLGLILHNLDIESLCRFNQVSRKAQKISTDACHWRTRLQKQWPIISEIYQIEIEKMGTKFAYARLQTKERLNWSERQFMKISLYQPNENHPPAVLFDENSKWMIVITTSNVYVQNKHTRQVSQIQTSSGKVALTALSNNHLIYSLDQGDICSCNLRKNTTAVIGNLKDQWDPNCLTMLNKTLCIGTIRGRIVFADIELKTCSPIASGHRYKVNVMQSNTYNYHLYSGSDDKTIISWDTVQCKRISTLCGHQQPIVSLAPMNEHNFASGSVDSTIKIWDERSPSFSYSLADHKKTVDHLTFIGNNLISAGYDKTVRVWDLRMGRSQLLIEDSERITGLYADINTVVAGSYGGNVHVASLRAKFPNYKIEERMIPISGMKADKKHICALFTNGELMQYDFSAEQMFF